MSIRNDAKQQQQEQSHAPETLIDTDLTADYQAGIDFANARVKAFGAGVADQMEVIRRGMKSFTGGKFVIAEATYSRPALPPSDEQANKSLIALLYGSGEVINEQI